MNEQRSERLQRTENAAGGVLYLCATPIGNLEDMTYRAVRILGEADLIAAEDTRHTRRLLAHFGIHTPLVSYHEHNKETKGAELIEKLRAGAVVACVSDAGLPGIADPGSLLAKEAIAARIPVVPLPGANAALTALIASGLDTTRFTFVGFLPRTKAHRRARLEEVAGYGETLLFYEAPHRLRGTLMELLAALGDRAAVLARELTKKFEEFRRGTLASLLSDCDEKEMRGEFVIVVEGAKEVAVREESSALPPFARAAEDQTPVAYVKRRIAEGQSKKDAMREAARALGLSRRAVYQALLAAEDSTMTGGCHVSNAVISGK
ncbi:MAG: 16S rRNA (cytidine(1402)-2'-O)-methyltransferase [Schwartzia sp. (in: firmicutes)]